MRKGQSSIEFLAVTGIGLLLIVGVAAVYLEYSKGNQDKAAVQQATTVGETLIEQAQTVYALGKNSWVTVEVSMPDAIRDAYVVENSTLVFDVSTKIGMVSQPVFSRVPLSGVNDVAAKSYVYNGTVSVHSGKMVFRVTSQGSQVMIQAIS